MYDDRKHHIKYIREGEPEPDNGPALMFNLDIVIAVIILAAIIVYLAK